MAATVIDPTLLVLEPKAKAGQEGPQILLSWELPPGLYEEFFVYRKLGKYPEFPGDGRLVFQGRENFFSDRKVSQLKVYYYTIFTTNPAGEYHWNETTVAKSLAFQTGHMHRQFLRLIPNSLLLNDPGEKQILREITVEGTDERFNFREDESKEAESFLWRRLKGLSLEFDRIKALIDWLPDLTNIDKTDIDWFPQFAYMLGITPEFTIPVPLRRNEIKNLVHAYKFKGTRAALVRLLRATTDSEIFIHETARNVWLVGDLLPDLSDPIIAFQRKTPADRLKYLSETGWNPGTYGHEKFIVFVNKGDKILTAKTMVKVKERTVPQFSPISTTATFVVMKRRTTPVSVISIHTVSVV